MTKLSGRKRWLRYGLLVGLTIFVLFDLQTTLVLNASKGYRLIYPLAEVQREAPWDTTTVAVVRTDTPGMPKPVDPDILGQGITTEQIEQLVELAVAKTGGMEQVVDADDKLVLIKPNWVHVERSGSGAITDCRVVRAVVKLVYKANPKVEIVVADGAGSWVEPSEAAPYSKYKSKVADGTSVNGYKQMVAELLKDKSMPGLKLRLADLNVPISDTVLVEVPGGGWIEDSYWTHKLVTTADKVISVPVLKIHGTRITVSIKNNIGIAAGSRYGWPKNDLDHNPAVMDKTIVDMASIAGVDYVVVDAITAMEKSNNTGNGSPLYRNMIIAGRDTVAVDAVSARLMGFNPDDISHVTMAALTGLGINDLSRINIVGEKLEDAVYLFQKNIVHETWLGRSTEGQSLRFWTFFRSDNQVDPNTKPVAGANSWTEPQYASDDFIDISQAFPNTSGRYLYAFSYFDAPKDQKAELRVGSSTTMRVWIDGKLVYHYYYMARQHVLYNDVVNIDLKAGKHQLLVETYKGTFSLTIAEPVPANVPNPRYPDRYDGTRVHGLEFFL